MNITDAKTIALLDTLRLNRWATRCNGACVQCLVGKADPSDKCAGVIDRGLGINGKG